ncbi:hypothetical protein ACIRTB_20885 [Streptomyces sp. NPDC101158]|uniref:hypothetical protein n=1 Tax=Streptomyces sp. NPDC101158 TaxID=3366117 RepID=UPI003803F6DF
MPRPQLPEPDPDTVAVRLPDGTLVLARLDHEQPAASPLQRALNDLRTQLEV